MLKINESEWDWKSWGNKMPMAVPAHTWTDKINSLEHICKLVNSHWRPGEAHAVSSRLHRGIKAQRKYKYMFVHTDKQ